MNVAHPVSTAFCSCVRLRSSIPLTSTSVLSSRQRFHCTRSNLLPRQTHLRLSSPSPTPSRLSSCNTKVNGAPLQNTVGRDAKPHDRRRKSFAANSPQKSIASSPHKAASKGSTHNTERVEKLALPQDKRHQKGVASPLPDRPSEGLKTSYDSGGRLWKRETQASTQQLLLERLNSSAQPVEAAKLPPRLRFRSRIRQRTSLAARSRLNTGGLSPGKGHPRRTSAGHRVFHAILEIEKRERKTNSPSLAVVAENTSWQTGKTSSPNSERPGWERHGIYRDPRARVHVRTQKKGADVRSRLSEGAVTDRKAMSKPLESTTRQSDQDQVPLPSLASAFSRYVPRSYDPSTVYGLSEIYRAWLGRSLRMRRHLWPSALIYALHQRSLDAQHILLDALRRRSFDISCLTAQYALKVISSGIRTWTKDGIAHDVRHMQLRLHVAMIARFGPAMKKSRKVRLALDSLVAVASAPHMLQLLKVFDCRRDYLFPSNIGHAMERLCQLGLLTEAHTLLAWLPPEGLQDSDVQHACIKLLFAARPSNDVQYRVKTRTKRYGLATFISQTGMRPNRRLSEALIRMALMGRDFSTALDCLKATRESRIKPTPAVYVNLLQATRWATKHDVVEIVHELAQQDGLLEDPNLLGPYLLKETHTQAWIRKPSSGQDAGHYASMLSRFARLYPRVKRRYGQSALLRGGSHTVVNNAPDGSQPSIPAIREMLVGFMNDKSIGQPHAMEVFAEWMQWTARALASSSLRRDILAPMAFMHAFSRFDDTLGLCSALFVECAPAGVSVSELQSILPRRALDPAVRQRYTILQAMLDPQGKIVVVPKTFFGAYADRKMCILMDQILAGHELWEAQRQFLCLLARHGLHLDYTLRRLLQFAAHSNNLDEFTEVLRDFQRRGVPLTSKIRRVVRELLAKSPELSEADRQKVMAACATLPKS